MANTIPVDIRRFTLTSSDNIVTITRRDAFSSNNNTLISARSCIDGQLLIKKPIYPNIDMKKYKFGREIHLWAETRHKNIVPFLGLYESHHNWYCVVMDYMLGIDLHELMKAKEEYTPANIYSWMYQAARALSYLHHQFIAHLDIKPGNLLVDPTRKILKICDFDSAIKMKEGDEMVDLTNCSFTDYFLDTKVPLGNLNVSRVLSMDIYSLAVTTSELFQKPQRTLVNDNGYCKPPVNNPSKDINTNLITDSETVNFIKRAWGDYQERPRAKEFREFMRRKRNEHPEN